MLRALVFSFVLFWMNEASAEMTGNQLKEVCDFYPRQTQATSMCVGYVLGTLDTFRGMTKLLKLKLACEPAGVEGKQLIAMTIKYLSEHPEDLHSVAASLITTNYMEAFRCKEK